MASSEHPPTIVITGASSGIGRAAAIELSRQGAEIAVVGRHPERTRAVAEAVNGTPFLADYDRLGDVRALAEALLDRYPRIDVLANNAGGLISTRSLTVDGFERTFQSNHLAPFLLTNLLLPRLVASGGRVVSTASVANRFGRLRLDDLDFQNRPWLGGWQAYGTSKIATIMFIAELARRTSGTGLSAFSFHPGFVASGFGADAPVMKLAAFIGRGHLGIPVEAGAAPLVFLAGSTSVDAPSGSYFDRLTPHGRVNPQAGDSVLAAQLWEASAERVGLA
ncbi:MAG: SDR family NAD(P)-dependent oxidoreductase [Microbacteriaceae bacterium]